MSNFKANILLNLESGNVKSKLSSIDKTLANLTSKPQKIKIEIDSSAMKDLNSLMKGSSSGKNKPKINVDTSGFDKAINKKREFIKVTNELMALQVSENKLKSGSNNENQLRFNKEQQRQKLAYLKKNKDILKEMNQLEKAQLFNSRKSANVKIMEQEAIAADKLVKAKQRASREISQMQANTASNTTLAWLRNNTKAAKQFGDELNRIAAMQKKSLKASDHKQLSARFKEITSEARKLGLTGASAMEKVKSSFKGVLGALGIRDIGRLAVRQVREMAQEVIAVNTAFVELRKVSDATDRQIANYFSNASKMAKELGTGISDVVRATSDWTRLGYSLQQAEGLARSSILFKNVSKDLSVDDATSSLVSTLQGFQLAADQSEAIVDKFNEVGNNYAIEAKGIGEALQRSGASLNAAGNTLAESIGLITAAMKNWLDIWKHILRTHLIAGNSLEPFELQRNWKQYA